ncbi:MAG: hypothetical protein ACI9EB_001219 [Pseudomonas sp.]|jgi:hypothetical protein
MDKKYLPAEAAQQSHQQPYEALKTDYNFLQSRPLTPDYVSVRALAIQR